MHSSSKIWIFLLFALVLTLGVCAQTVRVIDNKGTIKGLTAGLGIGFTNAGATIKVSSLYDGVTLLLNGSNQIYAANTTAYWNANKLQGIDISTTAPGIGQVLGYNGTSWSPVSPSTYAWLLNGNSGTTPVAVGASYPTDLSSSNSWIGTIDANDFIIGTNRKERFRITSGGNIGIGITTGNNINNSYLMTINPNSTIGNGISMNLPSNSYGINMNTASNANGLTYFSSSNASSNFYGAGSVLNTGNIVSGYLGYRNSSGISYGLYGVNGTIGTGGYATSANTYAAFLQGRTVISSDGSPSSPVGVDLEIQNTTVGPGNPVTLSMRQTRQNNTSGTSLAKINFGDSYSASDVPQAQIQAIRDVAGGASNDLPTALTFSTTPDGSATMAERMRISNAGNVGIGTTAPSTLLHINSSSGPAFRLVDGTQGLNKILTSDASGNATWITPGYLSNISSLLSAGTNTSLSGSGTSASPYKVDIPQSVATTASPTFSGATLTGLSTKGIVINTATGVMGTQKGTGFLKDDGTGTITYDNSTYLTSTLNNANIWVGNASNKAAAVSMSGDATLSNTGALTIANNAVTYGKMQVETKSTLLGNPSSTTNAVPSEITLGSGLVFSGTTLVNSGVTSFSAGTTGLTASSTTGSVTLGGTLGVANGGTGLSTMGTPNQILAVKSDGTALNWVSAASLSTVPINKLLPATGANSIDNTGFSQTWNWSTLNATQGLTLSASNITSGSILNIAATSGNIASTTVGGLLNIANNASPSGISPAPLVVRVLANTNPGAGMVITDQGNVGIGTTNPTTLLHINGGTTSPAFRLVDGNQKTGRVLVSMDDNGNATWSSSAIGWGLMGNALTDPTLNFAGTTDKQDFVLKANNTEGFRVLQTGDTKVHGVMTLGYGNGSDNTILGKNAFLDYNSANFPGDQNVVIGSNSFNYLDPTNSGNAYANVAIGYFAGSNFKRGNNNIFIGAKTSAIIANATNNYTFNTLNIGNIIYGLNLGGKSSSDGNTTILPYIGINTNNPGNTLEITQGTAGNSGLRLTNFKSAALLGTDANGDVITASASSIPNIYTADGTLGASRTVTMNTNPITWNSTGTTGNIFSIAGNSLTSGNAVNINATALTSGQGILVTGGTALTSGSLIEATGTISNTNTSSPGLLNIQNGAIFSSSATAKVATIQANSTDGSGVIVLANGNVGVGLSASSTPSSDPTFTMPGNSGSTIPTLGVDGTVNATNYTSPVQTTSTTLTYSSGKITWDLSKGANAKVTLTTNSTLVLNNLKAGMYGLIIVSQNTTGGYTLGFSASSTNSAGATIPVANNNVINGGGHAVTLTGTVSSSDILSFFYDGTYLWWTIGNNYN